MRMYNDNFPQGMERLSYLVTIWLPWLLMSWRCEERGHQQPQNWSFSHDIFQSQQQKALLIMHDIQWRILSTIITCLSLRSCPKEWLIYSILSLHCLHMISMLANCEIQLDGKNPHLEKASDLRVIHLWLWYETFQNRAQWNINSLMVKYIQVWNSILLQNI